MPQLAVPRLPDAAPPDPIDAALTPAAHSGPRILLIEDDALQRRGLLRLLGSEGVTTHAVDCAEAGLQAVATQPPYDLIITDLALGGLSGVDLARRLRQPMLVSYSGCDAEPPFFDVTLRKPAVGSLLQLIGARRFSVAVVQMPEGGYLARCHETSWRCYGRTAQESLQLLAQILTA